MGIGEQSDYERHRILGPTAGVPTLMNEGFGLPEAWERSIATLLDAGIRVPTQYDNPGGPPSVEAMMVMQVLDPLREPRIHRYFPGGPNDLEEYCMEVCEGIKDHWLRDPKDPEDKRWGYTYHGRMTSEFGVNQLAEMVKKLVADPFTRQAQVTIWNPLTDPQDSHSPCLQRLWVRLLKRRDIEEPHQKYNLTAHVYFRSRDALKAAFMNDFALIRLVNDEILVPVRAGLWARGVPAEISFARFVDTSDSYHIYGKDLKDVSGFWSQYGQRFNYEEPAPAWQPMMDEAREEVMAKVRAQDANRHEQGG